MFDETLRSKVNQEVGRLSGELHNLEELEQSLKIRRGRLEVEMRQAIALRDMFELLGRLGRQQQSPSVLVQAQPVEPSKPLTVVSLAEKPPDNVVPLPKGRPTLPAMIELTLKGIGDGLRSGQIIAQIKREWWPELPADRVYTAVHGMVQKGRLQKHDDRCKLPVPTAVPPNANGHAEAPL